MFADEIIIHLKMTKNVTITVFSALKSNLKSEYSGGSELQCAVYVLSAIVWSVTADGT